jgi:hypothetical protein
MELPGACRFGEPLGFTEKQVMGPLLSHKTIPGHKHKSSKQLPHHVHLRTAIEHQTSDRRPRRQDMEAPRTPENTDEYKRG